MGRVVRILMLGVVAAGFVLALTTSPSSGRPLGQATGYGSDTIPPSQLETGQPASAGGDSSGGGGNLTEIFGIGLAVIVVGGAGAYAYSRAHS
jgi:hypothetical protein